MKNKYKIEENYIIIYINHKNNIFECKIDEEDFDKINSFRTTWNLNINRTGHFDGVRTKIQENKIRKQYWIHRIIMECPEDSIIDHKNGDIFDNRKINLRIVNAFINARNAKLNKNSKTGIRNIYFENNKYRVRVNRKSHGNYITLEEAIIVANIERKKEFPEFLRN